MKWNLRLAAANRGIWKASELQRMLANRDLGSPAPGRCPGCGPATRPASSCPTSTSSAPSSAAASRDLLIPEPGKVSSGKEQEGQPAAAASAAAPPAVTPRRRDGRSLPPA